MTDLRTHHLYAQHREALLRYLARRTGRADVAEDLVQDVFVSAIAGADGYVDSGRERGWLFRIARNRWLDWRRRQVRTPLAESVTPPEPVSREQASLRVALSEALQQVDELDAELFLLREVAGLDYQEMAETCGLTVPAVRSRLFRARIALRDLLRVPTERRRHG